MLVSKRFLVLVVASLPLAVYAVDDEQGCKRMVDSYLDGASFVQQAPKDNPTLNMVKEWRHNGESECAIQRRLTGMAAQLETRPGQTQK